MDTMQACIYYICSKSTEIDNTQQNKYHILR